MEMHLKAFLLGHNIFLISKSATLVIKMINVERIDWVDLFLTSPYILLVFPGKFLSFFSTKDASSIKI